jgi:hypothetical protein
MVVYWSWHIINRNPKTGEQAIYSSTSMATLASDDDYAVIALLPVKSGCGTMLLLEGVRMESGRAKLQHKLASVNGGQTPQYFEALLHGRSVAGATIAVDVIAARAFKEPKSARL